MKYQDQKIKAIGRLTIISFVFTVLLALSLIYPDQTRRFAKYLPLSRHGNEDGNEYVWLIILVIMATICWSVNLGLIFTSPDQEVRFMQWSKRWRKTTNDFEYIKFDKLDPNYRKAAWRYFLERNKQ